MISGELVGLICLLCLAFSCVALALAAETWKRLWRWWYADLIAKGEKPSNPLEDS